MVKVLKSGSAYYVDEMDDSSGNWTGVAKLMASDGTAGDQFGCSVAVSGNIAIVGACYNDCNSYSSGSAYVFKRDEFYGNGIQVDKLTPSDGASGRCFGFSVCISGNTAVVGAYRFDMWEQLHRVTFYNRSAYVFQKDESSGNWAEVDKLVASDGANIPSQFGISVSISGNTAFVGDAYSGSAYLFQQS